MEQLKKFICILLLAVFYYGVTRGQSTVTAAGGNTSGSAGTVSYTIGQVLYTTSESSTGSVAHGVQQPYEISVVTGIDIASGILLECSVYPNPANDFLFLKIENYDNKDLSYKLYDSGGILLADKKVTGVQTTIPMSKLPPAVYFLKVIDGRKEIKTFKIIRN
jgi:hypothetical protein